MLGMSIMYNIGHNVKILATDKMMRDFYKVTLLLQGNGIPTSIPVE